MGCIICTLLTIIGSCTTGQGKVDTDSEIKVHENGDIANDLITGPLIRKLIPNTETIEARLAVSPEHYFNVTSPMDGFVRRILVNEGQRVQKGTLLCILDHPDIYTLQSSYLETKERINFYQQELQRKGDLSLDYAASLKSFQLAESNYRSALSLLNGYERKLQYLGIDADSIIKSGMVDDIRIFAPGNGVVISSIVETGTYLSTGDHIVEIANLDRMMAECRISVNLLSGFKNDDNLMFIPSIYDTISFPAHFKGNSPLLNDDQSFQARFMVNNSENNLYPGMTGWISQGTPEFSYFLPLESTISTNDDRFIFIFYENTIRKITIIPGMEINGFIEVKNPEILPAGARIIYKDIKSINSRLTENPAFSVKSED